MKDPVERERLLRALVACEQGEKGTAASDLWTVVEHPGGGCCIIHIFPLASGARRRDTVYSGAAAAILVKHLGSRSVEASTLLQHFGLTPRELSVLVIVGELGGVRPAASALGLTEGTVKTYLKSVFSKTGAKRRSDLVRIVSAFDDAFLNPSPKLEAEFC